MRDDDNFATAVQSHVDTPRSHAATALLPKFLVHREHDVSAVQLALEREDFTEIARIGHNLRGNGQSYGFPEVSRLGERLEAAANGRDAHGVGELVASLDRWRVGVAQRQHATPTSQVRLRTVVCDAPDEPRGIASANATSCHGRRARRRGPSRRTSRVRLQAPRGRAGRRLGLVSAQRDVSDGGARHVLLAAPLAPGPQTLRVDAEVLPGLRCEWRAGGR